MSGVEIVAEPLELLPAPASGAGARAPFGRLRGHPVPGQLALLYLLVVAVAAIFAPVLAPHQPNVTHLYETFQPPGWGAHLLGTDELGRDELSRLIYGARISLIAALIGSSVSLLIGTPLGVFCGYLGGAVEAVGNFVFDALMSMPAIIFAMVVIGVVGPGLVNAMVTIGIVISPVFYRLSRAATSNLKNEAFIEASIAIGCSVARTVVRHMLPNVLTPIITQCAVVAGGCIVAEASLSYLGLGVRAPTPSWGAMLTTAQRNLYQGSYLVYFPGLAVLLTVLACSLLADWLRQLVGAGSRSSRA
jgi:peptide/nickel transport system permease protein